jgi:hypothetical protein
MAGRPEEIYSCASSRESVASVANSIVEVRGMDLNRE